MGLVTVRDEWTKLVGHRFLNSQICVWIGSLQAVVCIWGVAQHCHSFIHYHKILRCDFLEGTLPLEAADAVIFDVGLFHSLWGIRGCVAEYLDGGFGRLAWCVSHIISLTVSLPFAFVSRPRPYFLWPLLIQQSAYGIGLLILLIAALPRILPQLMEPHAVPVLPISVYITGTMLNFFLLYVYWHWYWHVASLWGSAVRVRFGQIVRNANNRSRRDRPMLPKEPMEFPQTLTVDGLVNSSTIPQSPDEPEAPRIRRTLNANDSNVSLIFREAEEARMNGEVLTGTGAAVETAEPPTEKPTFFLEVPTTSKTVRARYPHEPPVIKAMIRRGKEEVAAKQLDVAAKRAMYRKRATSKEATIDLDCQETPVKSRKSIPNLEVVDIAEEEKSPIRRASTTPRKSLTPKEADFIQGSQKTPRKSRKSVANLQTLAVPNKDKSPTRRASLAQTKDKSPTRRASLAQTKDKSPTRRASLAQTKDKSPTRRASLAQTKDKSPTRRASLAQTKDKSPTRRTSVAQSKSQTKPPNGSIPSKSKEGTKRRQSTVTINPAPLVIKPATVVVSDTSTPSTPPPPIVATRLTPDAIENRMLRAQEDLRSHRSPVKVPEERKPRRLLPKTPDENPAGEISRPKFYLPTSGV